MSSETKPRKRKRRRGLLLLMLILLGGAVAGREQLLDLLFGKEEEFVYSPASEPAA